MHVPVSVVIRNRNEGRYLVSVLAALRAQTPTPPEVILVDNQSTDDSVTVAQRFGAKVIRIPEGQFTYGGGLNVGIAAASGELCVILSAHALPLGRDFIARCAEPFANERIAAARCVFVGKRADLMRWLTPEVLDASADVDTVVSKGPLASGCVIRRSAWQQVPFDETVIAAEDKLWAMAVLAHGYRILSPCSAFYYYLKPISPTDGLRKNDRELRAIFQATGERVGAARTSLTTTGIRAVRRLISAAPRAVLQTMRQEATAIELKLRFPRRPSAYAGRSSIQP